MSAGEWALALGIIAACMAAGLGLGWLISERILRMTHHDDTDKAGSPVRVGFAGSRTPLNTRRQPAPADTAGTSGLVAFLTARLDEDEAVTRRNLGKSGLGNDGDYPDYQTYSDENTAAADDYLTQFAPPRALAEVEAKRVILEICAGAIDDPGLLDDASMVKGLLQRFERLLASVYRSHPDWREDWAA